MNKLTTAQAARLLGLKTRQVRRLIEQGTLPAERFGAAWMIDPEDVERAKGRRRPGWVKGRKRT